MRSQQTSIVNHLSIQHYKENMLYEFIVPPVPDYSLQSMSRLQAFIFEDFCLYWQEEQMEPLNEGVLDFLGRIAKDAAVFIVKLIIEGAGLAATPAAGSGQVAARMVDLGLDAALIAGDLKALNDESNTFTETFKSFQAIWNAYKSASSFDDLYSTVKSSFETILSKAEQLGIDTSGGLEAVADKIQEVVEKISEKLQKAIVAGAKAAAGAIKAPLPGPFEPIASAVREVMIAASNSVYTVFKSTIGALPILGEWILDPDKMVDFLQAQLDKIIKFLKGYVEDGEGEKEEKEEEGMLSKLIPGPIKSAFGNLTGKMMKRAVSAILKPLEEQGSKIINSIGDVMKKVFGFVLPAMALYEILMSEDYEIKTTGEEGTEAGEEGTEAGEETKETATESVNLRVKTLSEHYSFLHLRSG